MHPAQNLYQTRTRTRTKILTENENSTDTKNKLKLVSNITTVIKEKINQDPTNKTKIINAAKMAIKVIQENLNHNGKDYFKNISYYGDIDDKFFNELLTSQKEYLEIICVHRNRLFNSKSDRKFSFYNTNYTHSADILRDNIQQLKTANLDSERAIIQLGQNATPENTQSLEREHVLQNKETDNSQIIKNIAITEKNDPLHKSIINEAEEESELSKDSENNPSIHNVDSKASTADSKQTNSPIISEPIPQHIDPSITDRMAIQHVNTKEIPQNTPQSLNEFEKDDANIHTNRKNSGTIRSKDDDSVIVISNEHDMESSNIDDVSNDSIILIPNEHDMENSNIDDGSDKIQPSNIKIINKPYEDCDIPKIWVDGENSFSTATKISLAMENNLFNNIAQAAKLNTDETITNHAGTWMNSNIIAQVIKKLCPKELAQNFHMTENDEKICLNDTHIAQTYVANGNEMCIEAIDKIKACNDQRVLHIAFAGTMVNEQSMQIFKMIGHAMLIIRLPYSKNIYIIDPKSNVGTLGGKIGHNLTPKHSKYSKIPVINAGFQSIHATDCVRHTQIIASLIFIDCLNMNQQNNHDFLATENHSWWKKIFTTKKQYFEIKYAKITSMCNDFKPDGKLNDAADKTSEVKQKLKDMAASKRDTAEIVVGRVANLLFHGNFEIDYKKLDSE